MNNILKTLHLATLTLLIVNGLQAKEHVVYSKAKINEIVFLGDKKSTQTKNLK